MRVILLSTFILLSSLGFSQNFKDAEVNGLAEKIADKIDAKNKLAKKKDVVSVVMVEHFRDPEGRISILGASLAEEFSLALSEAATTFSITAGDALAEEKSKTKINVGSILNGIDKMADGLINEDDYETIDTRNDAARTADGAYDITNAIKTNPNRYKGIDAVATATLTESNDQYSILLKVVTTDKQSLITAQSRGKITKTPFVLELEAEELQRREKAQQAGNDDVDFNPAMKESQKNSDPASSSGSTDNARAQSSESASVEGEKTAYEDFSVHAELVRVKRIGNKVVCDMRLTNLEEDQNFYLYAKYSETYCAKLIGGNEGHTYYAGIIEAGSMRADNYFQIELVKSNPLLLQYTFQDVDPSMNSIAKLSFTYSNGSYENIEFRNVKIN